LHELDAAVAVEPRLVQHRAGLAHDRGLLRVDVLVGTRCREPRRHSRLLEGRFSLVYPNLEVALIEAADHLTASHAGPEIDRDFREPPGDLGTEHDLLVGG